MTELNKRLGSMDYDGLIADIYPKLVVSGGTIRKLAEAATIKRGTILAKSSGTSGDGKLVVLGTAATGDEVLTAKVTVADSYAMTEADKDALRNGGIVFKAAAPAL